MPTLNYENAGALVEYDYLQGTIIALYPEDDTADVTGVCGELSKVPIFYHCDPDSVKLDNGAIEGAVAGFSVGDLVVVLKAAGSASSNFYNDDITVLNSAENPASGPKYYVVGHFDGAKHCSSGILFVDSYDGFWDFGVTSTSRDVKRFFIWDLASDDYATSFSMSDPDTGQIRKIEKADWPVKVGTEIIGLEIGDRLQKIAIKPSSVGGSMDEGSFIETDLAARKVIQGDFVWSASDPSKWSRVKAVEYVIPNPGTSIGAYTSLVTTLPIFSQDMVDVPHAGVCIASYIPLFHLYEYDVLATVNWVFSSRWYYTSSNYNYSGWISIYTADSATAHRYNAVDGTYEEISIPFSGRESRSSGGLAASNHDDFYNYDLRFAYKCPFNEGTIYEQVHSRSYSTYASGDPAIGTVVYGETDSYSGKFDNLSPVEYSFSYVDGYGYAERVFSGDVFLSHSINYGSENSADPDEKVWELCGPSNNVSRYNNAFCNDRFSWQHHVYRGYERNTHAQCLRRESIDSPPSINRSAKFEAAIQRLIDQTRLLDVQLHPTYMENYGLPLDMCGIYARYYSEPRKAAF